MGTCMWCCTEYGFFKPFLSRMSRVLKKYAFLGQETGCKNFKTSFRIKRFCKRLNSETKHDFCESTNGRNRCYFRQSRMADVSQ